MILVRSVIFLALVGAGVWFLITEPDRMAELSTIEKSLQSEAALRSQSLAATLGKYELASTLIAHSPALATLIAEPKAPQPAPKPLAVSGTGFGIKETPPVEEPEVQTRDEALQELSALQEQSGLNAVRILKKGTTDTVPAIAAPPELLNNGTWEMKLDAAFQGKAGQAVYHDAAGNPVVVFFTPYSGDPQASAVVLSEAALASAQGWAKSGFGLNLSDADGTVILSNNAVPDGEKIAIRQPVPALHATLTVAAAKPEQIGPWAIRSGAVLAFAILVLFFTEQQFARRRSLTELADSQRAKVQKLEQEATERAAELEQAKEDLAASENLALVGQVSASIGKEIEQPVAAIRAKAETAARHLDTGRPEDARQAINDVTALTDKISGIITDVSGYESSDPYQIGPVSIRPVVYQAATGTLEATPAMRDRFFMEVAEDVPDKAFVRADKTRLGQVIGSLLSSSWTSCQNEDQPEMVISLQQTRGNMVVAIDHNGAPGLINGSRVSFTIADSLVEGMGGKLKTRASALGGDRIEIHVPKFRAGTA